MLPFHSSAMSMDLLSPPRIPCWGRGWRRERSAGTFGKPGKRDLLLERLLTPENICDWDIPDSICWGTGPGRGEAWPSPTSPSTACSSCSLSTLCRVVSGRPKCEIGEFLGDCWGGGLQTIVRTPPASPKKTRVPGTLELLLGFSLLLGGECWLTFVGGWVAGLISGDLEAGGETKGL